MDRDWLFYVTAIEAAVHGWDASAGAGIGRNLDDRLAAQLLVSLDPIVNQHTRPGLFADPVHSSPDRSPADRLLAALGRDPDYPLRVDLLAVDRD